MVFIWLLENVDDHKRFPRTYILDGFKNSYFTKFSERLGIWSSKFLPTMSLFLDHFLVIGNTHVKTMFYVICWNKSWYELPHDKTNKLICAPSENSNPTGHPPSLISLCAQWVSRDPAFLQADNEDSDQTGQMPRLIWVFAGRTCQFAGFVMQRLIFLCDFRERRNKDRQNTQVLWRWRKSQSTSIKRYTDDVLHV